MLLNRDSKFTEDELQMCLLLLKNNDKSSLKVRFRLILIRCASWYDLHRTLFRSSPTEEKQLAQNLQRSKAKITSVTANIVNHVEILESGPDFLEL